MLKTATILLTTVLFVFYFCFSTTAQDSTAIIKNFITNNLVQIKSIDPNYKDFSDFEPIKKAIGNAKVVMLGEQSHGDGSAFAAKSRLIKYLHQELGFEVLAFESDFFNMNMDWDRAKNKEINAKDVWQKNVYSIWKWCEQTKSLFHYADSCFNTAHPLILTGFDSRQFGGYSKIDSFFSKLNLPFTTSSQYQRFLGILKEVLQYEYTSKTKKKDQEFFQLFLDTISIQLNEVKLNEIDFWKQEIKNLKSFALNAWMYEKGLANNVRDKQLADNLLWLINHKYADKKIIVWAHNAHIANDISKIKGNKAFFSMGTNIKKMLGDDVYILGLTGFSGKKQWANDKRPSKVSKPPHKSFEFWVNQNGYDYGFINFKDFNSSIPKEKIYFKMHWNNYIRKPKGNWLNVYDGVFYIKEVQPCKKCV